MCHRLGLIDLINRSIPCNTDLDLGTLVTGMVCDTLSGRSPLYKVEEFIAEQDTELLFGIPVDPHNFNDDALGNALDRIHNKGTLKLFTEVALRAAHVFGLDTTQCSFDTTSALISSNSWSRCFVWKAIFPSPEKCKTVTPAMKHSITKNSNASPSYLNH
jgi:hypothetical protein